MTSFTELQKCELETIEGGVIGWIIVGGLVAIGSFGAGYGLAYWLG